MRKIHDSLWGDERITIQAAGVTDIGLKRSENEDQFLIATVQRSMVVTATSLSSEALSFVPPKTAGVAFVVADGMGGAGGGQLASGLAVSAILDYLQTVTPHAEQRLAPSVAASTTAADGSRLSGNPDHSMTIPGMRAGLAEALRKGDAEVKQAAADGAGELKMGTTATLAYVLWPRAYLAHVGDSRCYLCRHGHLTQLTTDHTLAEKLKQETNVAIDEGSPWHHVLWNSIGGGENSSAEPEVGRIILRQDDILMLCSDGLTKHATEAEIARVLDEAPSANVACQQLVALANSRGGTDNITVVVARCVPPDIDGDRLTHVMPPPSKTVVIDS